MVNAGLLPMTVVDSHKAEFWAGIFDHIEVHEDLAVRTGGRSPGPSARTARSWPRSVNAYVRAHKKGTLLGNVVLNRYLEEHEVGAQRARRRGPRALRAHGRNLQDVRRSLRLRPPDAGRARLPGVGARPVGAEQGRSDRGHADAAVHRRRPQRRHPGHHDPREQHPRRHQVPALPARPLLLGPRDRSDRPDPVQLRRLQRRSRPGARSCAKRRRGPASMPTSGSATSSTWRRRGSAARPCSTSRTSPSTTSPTGWRAATSRFAQRTSPQ